MRGAREAPAPRDSLNFRRASLLSRNEFENGTFTIVLHATSSFTYVSVIYGANFPFKQSHDNSYVHNRTDTQLSNNLVNSTQQKDINLRLGCVFWSEKKEKQKNN